MYKKIPELAFAAQTDGMSAKQKQAWLRQKRQGESDALNWCNNYELRKASLSGQPIAEVIYDNRKHMSNGERGFGALRQAVMCGANGGKMPDGSSPEDSKNLPSGSNSAPSKDGGDNCSAPTPPSKDGGKSGVQLNDTQQALLDALGLKDGLKSNLDEEQMAKFKDELTNMTKDIAEQVAKDVASTKVEVHLEDEDIEPIVIEGVHTSFNKVLRTCRIHRRALLHGAKGTGKSTIIHGVAEAMNYPKDKVRLISCTQETSIYDLFGARDANGKFHLGSVLEAFEQGMFLFLDEFDALDPATGVALNAILDGCGQASVPQRSDKPTAYKGDGFLPVVACNTLQGATSSYTGRMKQDGATMNRFPALTRIHVDYCRKIERSILSNAEELCDALWSLRDKSREAKLDDSRIISTRDFHSASLEVAYRNSEAGEKNGDAMTDDQIVSNMVADWTDKERSKVGM